MKTQFFVTMFDSVKNYKLIAGGQSIEDNFSYCPRCKSRIDNRLTKKDLSIKLDHLGRLSFSPFLWNSGLHTIISDNVIDIWKKERVNGYEIGKVHISGWYSETQKPLPKEIPTYHNVVSTSFVQLLEPIKISSGCQLCGFQEYNFPKLKTYLPNGIQIDIDSWNGSDINTIYGYFLMICSEKVVQATLNAGYGKFLPFIRLDKYCTWEEFDIRKWKPNDYEKYYEGFLIRRIEDLEKK
jgi:hypothetical protein